MSLPNLAFAAVFTVFAVAAGTPAARPYCSPAVFRTPVSAPFGAATKPLSCRVYPVAAPEAQLTLAVATNEPDRELGLMFVRALPSRSGMIFKFPDGDFVRIFWMKNTLIPLDMVFVKADGTVSSVARNVPATTESTPDEKVPRRNGVGAYVIELNAGEAARDGIKAGAHLQFPPLDAK